MFKWLYFYSRFLKRQYTMYWVAYYHIVCVHQHQSFPKYKLHHNIKNTCKIEQFCLISTCFCFFCSGWLFSSSFNLWNINIGKKPITLYSQFEVSNCCKNNVIASRAIFTCNLAFSLMILSSCLFPLSLRSSLSSLSFKSWSSSFIFASTYCFCWLISFSFCSMVMPRLKKKFDIKLNMHNSTNVACDHVSEIDSKNLDQFSSSTVWLQLYLC